MEPKDNPQTVTEPLQASNGYLSRDAILGADDITYDVVDCPEWGGRVRVKSLTGRERADWQQASIQGTGQAATVNFRQTTVKLVALAVVDADGKAIFANADVVKLAMKNSAPLERIAEVAMRLSGIGADEVATLEKNSEETPSDD